MKFASRSGYLGFRVIGVLKLLTGVLALLAGIGVRRLIDPGHGEPLERFFTHLGLDPHNHLIHSVISRLTGIDRAHLRAIEAGTLFYAVLHTVEGIGLILERDWAGYLVVVATSSLIPFEIYEITKSVTPVRVGLLILNLAIVFYLVAKLRSEYRDRSKHPT